MGVSTEIWRARIGSFLPVVRAFSTRDSRERFQRLRRRLYKCPPNQPQTNQVTKEILRPFILLLGVLTFSLHTSMLHIQIGGNFHTILAVTGVLWYIGMYRGQKEQQPKLSLELGLAICCLLLICGDIESNPGPKDQVRMIRHCSMSVLIVLKRLISEIFAAPCALAR